jgi:hypothetical protein
VSPSLERESGLSDGAPDGWPGGSTADAFCQAMHGHLLHRQMSLRTAESKLISRLPNGRAARRQLDSVHPKRIVYAVIQFVEDESLNWGAVVDAVAVGRYTQALVLAQHELRQAGAMTVEPRSGCGNCGGCQEGTSCESGDLAYQTASFARGLALLRSLVAICCRLPDPLQAGNLHVTGRWTGLAPRPPALTKRPVQSGSDDPSKPPPWAAPGRARASVRLHPRYVSASPQVTRGPNRAPVGAVPSNGAASAGGARVNALTNRAQGDTAQ